MDSNRFLRLSPVSRTICIVLGGILIHLTLGTIYTIGNLNPYLASYLRAKVPGHENISYSVMSWLFAVTAFAQACFVALGGMMERRLGPKWATLIGCVIMSLGVVLTYFSIQYSFWLCLFTYGFVVGCGTGIAYNPPLVCAMKRLRNHRGLANGLILTGFGFGAFVFNQVQTAYVNPWNYTPDVGGYFKQEKLLERVPSLFLVLSGIYIIMQVVGSLLLMDPTIEDRNDPSRTPLLHTDEDTGRQKCDTSGTRAHQENEPTLSPKDVLKSGTFWCLWLTMLFNGQLITFMSSYFKIFGQTFIHNDYLLAAIGSVSSIFNSLGRILWGYLGDRFSYQRCMVSLTALLTVWMLTVYSTRYTGEAAYFLWISLIFLTFSGEFSLLPMATAQAFGTRTVGINYGLVFTASAISTIANATLTTALLDSLGFMGMFLLMGGAGFCAFCINMIIHVTDHGAYISKVQ